MACSTCAKRMQRNLFGGWQCYWCDSQVVEAHEDFPDWFRAGSTTPLIHIRRVREGLHPSGRPLHADPAATCGDCQHLKRQRYHTNTYYKCGLVPITRGPATDVRLKWRGCDRYTNPYAQPMGDLPFERL